MAFDFIGRHPNTPALPARRVISSERRHPAAPKQSIPIRREVSDTESLPFSHALENFSGGKRRDKQEGE
jgi:hypothetical protein